MRVRVENDRLEEGNPKGAEQQLGKLTSGQQKQSTDDSGNFLFKPRSDGKETG